MCVPCLLVFNLIKATTTFFPFHFENNQVTLVPEDDEIADDTAPIGRTLECRSTRSRCPMKVDFCFPQDSFALSIYLIHQSVFSFIK
jgi:hypothetical protein